MIISSLVKRYEAKPTVPQGWQRRGASHALDISENGELLGVIPLEWEEIIQVGNKKVSKIRKKIFNLPSPGVRSSGVKGVFLCDNVGYILGIDEKRGVEKFEAARELHMSVLKNVHTVTSKAIKAWFNVGIIATNIDAINVAIPDAKALNQATFVFQVNGKNADYDDLEIRNAWNDYYSQADCEEQILCLVTGEYDIPERIHDTLKLRGGQSSGSNLISANANSFTSYGKTKDDRATEIGKYAAFAHITALRDLLDDEKHRQFLGGDTLVYWAESGKGEEEALFSWMSQPTESDSDKLNNLIKRLVDGNSIEPDKVSLNSKFHLLCLSPNASRISIRFFFTDSFGVILKNSLAHYRRLEIFKAGNDPFPYLPYRIILNETTVTKKSADITPLLGGQYMHSIITNSKYPMTMYQAIFKRIRAGEEISKAKAAVIKAVLAKNYDESEVTTVSINTQTDNKPYVLGRLFSVLEMLQKQASGGSLNSTIRDRYFASACANPGNVFPTILKLSNHHSAKLDNAVYYEKLKAELLGKLDMEFPFPKTLTLDDQGRFILGYYHQTQDFYTSKNKENNNEE